MKVSGLSDEKLNYWVARAEGLEKGGSNFVAYSAFWAVGGPIIEREDIIVERSGGSWIAKKANLSGTYYAFHQTGKSYLIAAMRCFVASQFGDEVPNE